MSLAYASHTPAHIAAFFETLIARLPAPPSPTMLCISLPEMLDPEIRYVCLGTDITTPLPLPELVDRIAAVLRTPRTTLPLAHGWSMQTDARTLTHTDHAAVLLTELEGALLTHLLRASPHETHRDTLMRDVWHYEPGTQTHTLETHLYRLRGKLEKLSPCPCRIITTETGYRLDT